VRLGGRGISGPVVVAAVAGALVAGAVGAFGWLANRADQPGSGPVAVQGGAEDYGAAPSYTFTDQHGRPFSSSKLTGKVQVVSYLFPYCTTYCPLIARTLAQTQQLVDEADLTDRVAFVAFNVDPLGAGPDQRLAAFLRQEGIDPNDPAWHYLTGGPAEIRRVVADGFHIYYERVSLAEEEQAEEDAKAAGDYTPQPELPNALADKAHVDYDIVHNDYVEIVDPAGTIRTLFNAGEGMTARQILDAIQQALGSR
jgi:cytochrome oxidase Cu insertion factor (SCO1/SenC/PrrC family)